MTLLCVSFSYKVLRLSACPPNVNIIVRMNFFVQVSHLTECVVEDLNLLGHYAVSSGKAADISKRQQLYQATRHNIPQESSTASL